MEVPNYIKRLKVTEAPIKYKWDNDIALRLYGDKHETSRIYTALEAPGYKANVAIGIAIAEIICWRLEKYTDITDALQRIDAAWASQLHPGRVNDITFRISSGTHPADKAREALEIALALLGELIREYKQSTIYVAEPTVKLAVLAQHVLPDKKVFTEWLTESLKRAAKAFPSKVDYDEETYDASNDPPVPREFFDPDFKYSEAAAKAAVESFIKSLDPAKNPYLRVS